MFTFTVLVYPSQSPLVAPMTNKVAARTSRVGLHRIEMHPPDVFVLHAVGPLEAAHVHGIFDLFEQFAPGPELAFFLVNLQHMGTVTPSAREVVGKRQLPPTYGGIALFGGNFQQQLIGKLATTAGWVLRGRKLGKPMPVVVQSEAEAWIWIAERRLHQK